MADFKSRIMNINQFKEIKSLSLQKAEAYLDPKRASTTELFCEYTSSRLLHIKQDGSVVMNSACTFISRTNKYLHEASILKSKYSQKFIFKPKMVHFNEMF